MASVLALNMPINFRLTSPRNPISTRAMEGITAIARKMTFVTSTIFTGGEKMTVWVTDDANHVPVRIESPIIVGSVKVDMMRYRNLRFPMRSLKKLN